MRKSLVISWISCCDYPLFRLWLRKYGSFFDEIIIYWDVQFRHPFFWAFIQQDLASLPNVKFIDPVAYDYATADWRSTATNELVKHATGDWIFSIEQDWFAKDWSTLLKKVEEAMLDADLIGWENPTNFPYIHPAFFGIKRETLEKTSKDFSAHPEINGCDHFGMITHDVRQLQGKVVTLQQLGFNCDFHPDADMFHLGGYNQNVMNGLTPEFQFHRPEAFSVCLRHSLDIGIPQDPRFIDTANKILDRINLSLEQVNELENQWGKFFKI